MLSKNNAGGAKLEVSVQEAQGLLRGVSPPRLLDVRSAEEREIAKLEGDILLTSSLLEEIVEEWDKNTPILCYCHHGYRSLNVAASLRHYGFDAQSIRGGIDAWAYEIDARIGHYKMGA